MPVEQKCEHCGQPFYCYPSDIEKGRKYCGLACRSAHRFDKDVPAASRTPVDFTCQECGKPFTMMQGYLTAYRKKFGHDPHYCSNACSGAGRRRKSEETHTFECPACGKTQIKRRKPGGRLYREQKYCDQACKKAHQSVLAAERFREALATGEGFPRHQKRNGYWVMSVPSGVTGRKHSVFEHRFVMEQHIGRKLLPEESVHHVDGNRSNNARENLELFSSRHGPGQRVVDKVAFAVAMLQQYPDFAAEAGLKLCKIGDCGCDH